MVRKIIDEESIPTETRITNNTFVNASPIELMLTPTVNRTNDTDESFHSAISDNDVEPLIANINSKDTKKNKKKFRRALGCIKNQLTETPKTDMRRKLWRNMEDERIKKGVENTPPLPFKDLTASAPPKLYRNRKFS